MKMIENDENIKRYFRIRSISQVSHETKWMPFIIEDKRDIKLQLEEGDGNA